MSSSTVLIIAAALAAWLLVLVLVWLYCVSAAREDRRIAASADGARKARAVDDADEKRIARN